MTPPGTICAYCGQPRLTGAEKPEHPIPAAMGSSAKVFTVCDPCNERADVEIDQPFLGDVLIQSYRHLFDVRDHRRARRRRVQSPLLSGYTADGAYVSTHEDGTPKLHPTVVPNPDGSETLIASTQQEMDVLLAEKRRRAVRDGEGVEILNSGSRSGPLELTNRVSTNLDAYTRMASKIALGLASYAYPEAWRTSDEAILLRRLMRGEETAALFPDTVDEQSAVRQIVQPPNHAAFFVGSMRSDKLIVIVLFGTLVWALPVVRRVGAPPEIAWHLDPRRPRLDGRTTYMAMIQRA
jgi:hypothetical protein